MTVFRRGQQNGTPKSTIEYRHSSLLWIVAFPLAATAAYAAVVVKLDAAKPEDMHCDANSPEWVRFLGYAGVPLVLAVPAFFVSVATAYRLFKTHMSNRAAYLNSSRGRSAQITGTPVVPAKVPHYRLARAMSPQPVNPTASLSVYAPSIGASPMMRGNMSLPSSPMGGLHTLPPMSPSMRTGRAISIRSVSEYPDDASVYDHARNTASPVNGLSTYQLPYGRRPAPQLTQSERDAFSEAGYDMKSREEKIPESPEDDSEKESLEADMPVHAQPAHASFNVGEAPISGSNAIFSPPQSLMPAIWRLAFFQISFFGIEMLAALSTIIDVATKAEKPMELGTQHFALLLAAWGPLFVFGHLPAVRTYVWSAIKSWRE